ncbi:MAG: N-acetyltransferase family protein [Sphingobacteriales bacterium]|nr:MAG: N-acetyltransferase family protein [Sphingobacteriales bacterium]
MDCTFKEVETEDLPLLADILNYYILNTTVTFHKEPLQASDMAEKVFFTQPHYQSFSIVTANKVIGYCAVSQWKKQEAYRHTAEINIYLHSDYTGKGIGHIAVRHLEEFAKRNDIQNLIAGLCSENMTSRRLFEKSGYHHCATFQKVGDKFGRNLDVVYLQKLLSD